MKTPLHERKSFTVTITEADRQNADSFTSPYNCLLATAVKRRGAKTTTEGVSYMRVDGEFFSHPHFGFAASHFDCVATQKPFYRPNVVGTKIKFTRK